MNWYKNKIAQIDVGQVHPSMFEGDMPTLEEKGPYHLKPKSRAKPPVLPPTLYPSGSDADEIVSRIDSIHSDIDSEKSSLSKQIQMNPQFENIYNSLLGNFESFSNLLRKTKTDLTRNFSTTNLSPDIDQKIKGHETKRLEDNLRKREMEKIESERGGKLEEEFENLTPEQKEEKLKNQLEQQEKYRQQYPGKRFTPLEGSPEYKELIRSLSPEKKFPPEMEKLRALHNLKQQNLPKHKSVEEALSEQGKTPEERRRENLRHLQEIAASFINSLIKYATYFDKNRLFKRADSLDNLSNKILELAKIL